MPRKRDYDSSYGQKIISLFAKLLFSRRSHSLTELSQMMNCSKQSIMRMVDDITMSYGIEISESYEGRRKYYQIKHAGSIAPINLSESELSVLQMCRAFTEHLLGGKLFEEAARALGKSQTLVPGGKAVSSRHFASFIPGTIDYTPHHESIHSLIRAMEDRKVCKIIYKSIMAKRAKTFYIKPLKIFSHKDTIYLHARMARYPGKPYKEPDFDPLLAIHRLKNLEITERSFEFPKDYDFEKFFNQNFGVIKEEAFEVELEFTGYAAKYIAERIWSPDQKLTEKKDGTVKLKFSASSEPELIGWVLSFADEARVVKPKWLVRKVKETVGRMKSSYANQRK